MGLYTRNPNEDGYFASRDVQCLARLRDLRAEEESDAAPEEQVDPQVAEVRDSVAAAADPASIAIAGYRAKKEFVARDGDERAGRYFAEQIRREKLARSGSRAAHVSGDYPGIESSS